MKQNWPAIAISIATLISLPGCAGTALSDAVEKVNQDAMDAGSPYRWKYGKSGEFEFMAKTLIGVEATTVADPELDAFTRQQISSMTSTMEISPEQEPDQVRLVSLSESGAQEVWVYKMDDATQAFVVSYEPSATGGTDVNITGPW